MAGETFGLCCLLCSRMVGRLGTRHRTHAHGSRNHEDIVLVHVGAQVGGRVVLAGGVVLAAEELFALPLLRSRSRPRIY